MSSKVFCIGFHKTGTKSIGHALTILGYRVLGLTAAMDPDISQTALHIAKQKITEYDAFQDNPWPILYKELDNLCPDSKFILTLRNEHGWMNSVISHFGKKSTPMREWIYGAGDPEGNEEIYLRRYQQHNVEVMQYFRNRPHDLLVLPLDNFSWDPLCQFLNKPVPTTPFPRLNTRNNRMSTR